MKASKQLQLAQQQWRAVTDAIDKKGASNSNLRIKHFFSNIFWRGRGCSGPKTETNPIILG